MIYAKFVVVRNADINEDTSENNYDVALQINNEFFYINYNLTKDEAINLSTLLNKQNDLIGN
jgi:hypothetical protein